MSKNNFEFCYIIGKGGFGKVWKIKHKKTSKYYALKEMSKLKIIEKKSEYSINFEREILSKLNNPFIVNMYYAFQDSDNLYLVMDYLKGGDLRFHLTRHIHFSEEQSRFFICNLLIALEYIHSQDIIHRDIKPENLVLDENGYTRITDFGIAKKKSDVNKMKGDTSGTPGYMAPEIMRGIVHSFEVDFFAVGIVAYEFMKGKRPYNGKNRKEIKEEMIMKQIVIKEDEIPEEWTKESIDFINKLVVRKRENRLGYNGIKEVKEHPWIKYYPWEMILDKTLPSPFIPQNKDNFDLRFCAKTQNIGQETQIRYEEILMSSYYNNIFKNFFYNYEVERKEKRDINKNNNNNKNLSQISFKIYRQLSCDQNKIVINSKRDKFNTINEIVNNNKNECKEGKESLFLNIFKNQNLKGINDLFAEKMKKNKNFIKSREKSSSNINNPLNINQSLNSRVGKKILNISSILSPVRSKRNILKRREYKTSSIIYKKSRPKSNVFMTKDVTNLNIPTCQNKKENKNKIIKASSKCLNLLSKSNSYKMKCINTAKNSSVKKINYQKKNNSRNILISNNLTPNCIPNKNKIKKNRMNISNGNITDSIINCKEIQQINKNKTIIKRNDLSKLKINKTLNNVNIVKTNTNLNKTFFNGIKSYEFKNNKENIVSNKNKIPIKKRIYNNNIINNSTINESIKNMLKSNSKYISLKDIKEKNEIISNINDLNDKENKNINIKNIIKKNSNKKTNKNRILVNKRNKNKGLIFELEKTKYNLNNNSINSTKNSYIYKYYRNKNNNLNSKTLNTNSIFMSGFVKDGSMTSRNLILSYKQK